MWVQPISGAPTVAYVKIDRGESACHFDCAKAVGNAPQAVASGSQRNRVSFRLLSDMTGRLTEQTPIDKEVSAYEALWKTDKFV